MPVALYVKNRAAFEFSKRKFVRKYGPDLPVWALLVSGSTGGVRLAFSIYRLGYIQYEYVAADRLLAYFLPSGLVNYGFASHRIPHSPFAFEDVVKSRIQLRTTPPSGTPVQYIAGELKAVVAESGM